MPWIPIPFATRYCFSLFEVVIAWSTVTWVIMTVALMIRPWWRAPEVREGDFQHLTNIVKELKELRKDDKEALGCIIGFNKRCLQPATQCAVRMDMAFFVLDIATDAKQIFDLYLGKQHFLAGLMTCILCTSTTALSKDLYTLRAESKESVRTGIYTDKYLLVLNFERGFESALSLLASAYVCRFAVTDAGSCVSNLFNICMSSYGLASFLQREAINLARFQEIVMPYSTRARDDISL